MWTRSHSSVYQDVKAENIWRIWTDVNNWPRWHGDLDYCKMDGPFVVGNHFMLKPKGAPAVKIVLTEIVTGQEFTDCTQFFGAKMYDTHKMEVTAEGVRLSNKLVVVGPLKWLWIKLVARHVAKSVESEMDALVRIAKQDA